MRWTRIPSNALVAALWLSWLARGTIAASPHFIMPLSRRTASIDRLAFVSRGGTAGGKTTSMPSASDLLDSITSSLGEKVRQQPRQITAAVEES